jgi:hypothetical protein
MFSLPAQTQGMHVSKKKTQGETQKWVQSETQGEEFTKEKNRG